MASGYHFCIFNKRWRIQNFKGAIKNGQSRETGNTGHTRWRKTKQIQKTICVRHHYMQTNTNNVSKRWTLPQTTGGKDFPKITIEILFHVMVNHPVAHDRNENTFFSYFFLILIHIYTCMFFIIIYLYVHILSVVYS